MTTETTAPEAAAPTGIDAAFAEAGITDADFGAAPAPVEVEQEAAPEPASEPATTGPERDEHGRFKPREAAPETPQEPEKATPAPEAQPTPVDAPQGLSEAAKAAWKDTPDAVRADVQRRFREMETGLQGYQRDFGELKEYASLAKANGTTIKAALDNYVGIEKMLATNPGEAIKRIAANAGFDLSKLTGAQTDQPQADQTIAALRQEIAELRQGFGGVQQTLQQQREHQTMQQVEAFAAQHPRFEELGETIAEILRTGFQGAKSLEDAYALADRLNPAPQPAPPPVAPQTRKPVANLSVAGAPGNGSNPTTRKPPANKEAHLDEIFRQVGIS